MTCNECGKELPDDSVFCQFCGKRMEAKQNTPKNICKYCNKENNLNAVYCRFCGENIEKPLEIAPGIFGNHSKDNNNFDDLFNKEKK